MNAQLVRQHSAETAKCCAASCCGRVGLFFLLFILGMVALVVGAVRELPESSGDAFSPEEHHGHVSLYLFVLSTAPPIFILVYLSRTFGTSIDRCQVVLTFFTAVLWTGALLAGEQWMIFSGALRAVYRLDSTCDRCFGAGLCTDTCALGLSPPNASAAASGSWSSAADGVCDESCAAWGTDCTDCGPAEIPTMTDADPIGSCPCSWRVFVSAFFVAGLFEETLKYVSVVTIYTKSWVADPSALVLYAVTAACGFALVENMLYVASASFYGFLPENGIRTAAVRAFLAIPLHAGTGCIIGAMLSRRRFVGRPEVPDVPESQQSQRLG
jgi:hypothetical protein